jgi:hypothetical protein
LWKISLQSNSGLTLQVDTSDGVVGVVGGNITGTGASADVGHLSGVGRVHGVAVVGVQQAIDLGAVVEATGEGVEGAVLLDKDDDILDLAPPVASGTGVGRDEREASQGCESRKLGGSKHDVRWRRRGGEKE